MRKFAWHGRISNPADHRDARLAKALPRSPLEANKLPGGCADRGELRRVLSPISCPRGQLAFVAVPELQHSAGLQDEVRVAAVEQILVLDPKGFPELLDLLPLVGKVGLLMRDRLELKEVA